MKIKCKVNCNGMGYENFKVGQERDIQKDTAKVLLDYGYAEPVEAPKKPEKQKEPEKPDESDKTDNEEKQLEP